MKKVLIIIGSLAIIFCLLFYLFNLFKPGYVYENGTWNYVSYDEAVGRRVSPIDLHKDKFKVLKYGDFARDDKSVYFKSTKVEGADPDTFQIISNKGHYSYAKDKTNVYVYLSDDWSIFRIIKADPNSFEILEPPYSKDKNDAFCGNLPLYVDDITKFEVKESSYGAMMSSVDSFLGTASDKSDTNSEYERNRYEYNRKKYGYITDWIMYSEDGQAKTDKLTYKGYKLVEDKRQK